MERMMAWPKKGFSFDTSNMYAPDQIVSISNLSTDLLRPIIVGMVIAKQDPRGVSNKRQPGPERFVLNFTIRDSPMDTLNVVCWGEESAIRGISSGFMIGNIIKIKNAQVVSKQDDGSDERFRPRTNSAYQLNVSPLYSEVVECDEQYIQLFQLLHYPIHSTSEFVTLVDIVFSGQNIGGICVNLLVAVKNVGSLQDVRTKDGRMLKKCQLSVFDQTHPAFPVLIWEEETARFILKSCQRRSVLLISDVRISYSDFLKGVVATATSCTVFTPDPAIPEAEELAAYARTVRVEDNPSSTVSHQSSSITSVYTAEDVERLRTSNQLSAFEDTEGVIYACFTTFDLDGYSRLTSLQCSKCKQVIRSPQTRCSNGNCDVGSRTLTLQPEEYFDIPVCLTDHTGSVKCSFSGPPVEALLKMTVEKFLKLTDEEKTNLKWHFLGEKFKFTFKIPQAAAGAGNRIVHVTSCEEMTEDDITKFLAAAMGYL